MTTLHFQGLVIKPVIRDNRSWLRLSEIEEALGYARKGSGLTKVFLKHADEFTTSMTRVLKLSTAGGKQAVRVFSLRGAHLLTMFARTDTAKAFRVWVLNILDSEVLRSPRQQVKSYYFPISTAEPHDRDKAFGNASLTPAVLIDPRNRAPELDLLDQLAADGHDVSGPRMRILAMRYGLERAERARCRMGIWERRMADLGAELRAYQREEGRSVLFSRPPDEANAMEAIMFADQFAVRGAA